LHQALVRSHTDSTSMAVKAAAIHTLGIAMLYGGGAESAIEETMDSLSDIVVSDGMEIEAHDAAVVVVAAIEGLALMATYIDDLEDSSEDMLEGLTDQLDSTDVKVQIAAGEAIALVYEKSHTEREPDDEPSTLDPELDDFHPLDAQYVQRYAVAPANRRRLVGQLQMLVRTSEKSVSRSSRAPLRQKMLDVLHTVEHPGRGPGFRTAQEAETGRALGHGIRLKIPGRATYVVDRWWKWHRLQALKRVLGGGFNVHFVANEVVEETLM
jgi:hypothetical protein